MNAGKLKYDGIEIPEQLGGAIDAGIHRAEKQRRSGALRRTVAGAAAAAAVLFAVANIMPVYSYAADIPVLGEIVRVLHIGSGGEITDGAHAGAESESGKVVLTFSGSESAPLYSVKRFLAPNRLVLNLYGVRGADFDAISSSLLGSGAVLDVYRNMYLDDSALSITVVMKDGYDCAVSEYASPGALTLDFTDGGSSGGTVYYLRSEAVPYSEQLGALCEEYHAEDASQVKTASGDYFVAIGSYESESEAEAALNKLNAEHGDSGFYVASGEAGEIPEV